MSTPPESAGAPLTGANRFLLPEAQRQSQEAQALARQDATLAFAIYQHYQQLGVHQSADAVPWLQRAAEWGHPVARYNLGVEHLDRYEKLGADEDRQAARALFRAAADAGHERAVQRLRELD